MLNWAIKHKLQYVNSIPNAKKKLEKIGKFSEW